MKIHSAKDLKCLDQKTIEIQKITSWKLMERASSTLFSAIQKDFDLTDTHFTIFCGQGNNGGDGLALARMLYQSGTEIAVYLMGSEKFSEDNLENQKHLKNIGINILDFEGKPEFRKDTVIVDALFGYGLSRPLDQDWIKIIDYINDSGQKIISVDMPSGLMADQSTPKSTPIIKAETVYTFQCPKLALLQPENAEYLKSFKILNINLEDIKESTNHYLTLSIIKSFIKRPSRFSHKGNFGHSLIIGGSYGKIGAPLLSSNAALKTGCGLVTAYLPKCGYVPFQSAFPEAMVITDSHDDYLTELDIDISIYSAVGIGMGMGQSPETAQFFKDLIAQKSLPPLVIDADGLNLLAQNKDLLRLLPKNTILTPHPKELKRLIGEWSDDFEKLKMAMQFATNLKIILIIKGANTVIVLPSGNTYFNSTGNYGMAKGGSGDVLTGIITSLLAQQYSPHESAILGVYIHGLAGDLSSLGIHPKSMTASDIINHLTDAWNAIE